MDQSARSADAKAMLWRPKNRRQHEASTAFKRGDIVGRRHLDTSMQIRK
jgi:hypothetical protein